MRGYRSTEVERIPTYKAIHLQTKQSSVEVTMLPDGAVEIRWQNGQVMKYTSEQVDQQLTSYTPKKVDKEVKLLRSIGYQDKHGTMIYEGDIITITEEDGFQFNCMVFWAPQKEQFCLRWLAFVRSGQDQKELSEVNWRESEMLDNAYFLFHHP